MTSAKPEGPPTAAVTVPARRPSSGVVIVALATGFVMATLDITVVNVAGATIENRLHASLTQLTWVVDGYVLTFASLLMLAGGLSNQIGAKKIYMAGMATFFVASLASALSTGPGMLIASRFVQGVGAALFMPSSLALLVFSFPQQRQRTRMLGLWSAIVATSSALGPTVGGLMVNAFGWQSIFLLNLPVGAVGMFMTRRYVAGVPGREGVKLAVSGHVIWIVLLASVSFALIQGPQLGWGATPVVVSYLLTMVTVALLVARERRATNLVMPWQLFRRAGFAGANLVGFGFNFALFGSAFLLGLYLQHARGATPFQAGLELLPMTIFFPVANVVYSRISGRFSNGRLLTAFLLLAGVASLTMVTISRATPYWLLALAVGVANIGGGIISPAMTATLVDAAGPEHANASGSVLNVNRQIGSLVGIAMVGVVLGTVRGWDRGAALSFLLIGVAYLIGACAAWRLIARPARPEADGDLA
ncbi:MAG TPA: MFS transporter [Rugosimonospora sp.]|nr:MFS transporter [Rugosimonospora sp.]